MISRYNQKPLKIFTASVSRKSYLRFLILTSNLAYVKYICEQRCPRAAGR